MTHQEAKETVARLICLSRAVGNFDLPIRIAARWVQLADLLAFQEEVERHIRALAGVFDDYLAKNPDVLERCDHDTRLIVWDASVADARKNLALLDKIAHGQVELDIGRDCLPEFR